MRSIARIVFFSALFAWGFSYLHAAHPILSWNGTGYFTSDGLDPESGNTSTSFKYQVMYTDADNNPPLSGYPKVHIKKGGIEISGSPFTMSYYSGTYYGSYYDQGVQYSYSKSLALGGADYTYLFEAYDNQNKQACGVPLNEMSGPTVTDSNTPPMLSWVNYYGSSYDYVSDGVDPESGNTTATVYTYRVTYKSVDGKAPASGFPKLHIRKGGATITGSPFAMVNSSGGTNYSSGVQYSYPKSLTTAGPDYTYFFEANDSANIQASGPPVIEKSGPTVTSGNCAPYLSWVNYLGYYGGGFYNYVTEGLQPKSGNVTTTSFVFKVNYKDVDGNAPKSGYPKLHILKGGSEISGSPFLMTLSAGSDYTSGVQYSSTKTLATGGANYTYYFEAQDSASNSAVGAPTVETIGPMVGEDNIPTCAGINANQVTITLNASGANTVVGQMISNAGAIEKYGFDIPLGAIDAGETIRINSDPSPPSATEGTELLGGAVDIDLGSGKREFKVAVTFTLSVNAATLKSKLNGRSSSMVKAAYYNGVRWIIITDSKLSGTDIQFTVDHLTKFAIVITVPPTDLAKVVVYPNPFNPSIPSQASKGITFDGLTQNSTIKIYDVSGGLVKTISPGTSENPGTGIATWNAKNEDGDDLGIGLYLYVITEPAGGVVRGKLGVKRQ